MSDRTTARTIAVAVLSLVAVLAAACGGGKETKPTSTASVADRMVAHAMGQTTVKGQPQRVVVLDTGELDSAVALGVIPVGAVVASQGGGFPAYLAGAVGDKPQKLGTNAQPNLEAIAALQPDLIMSNKLRHAAIYPQLSQIAPTVFTESVGVTWRENFLLHAEALGRTDEAEELLARYDRTVSGIKDSMKDKPPLQASVIRSVPNQVRIMMKQSFIGTILRDAGLARPPAQDKDKFMEEGTEERVPDMNGDVIFLSRFGTDHSRLDKIMATPQWKALPAVANGKIHEVDDDVWMLGIGVLAAQRVADDLSKQLAA